MKTCPKCKTTGIPYSAQFCPKCGAALTDAPSPWREKYKELKEHLEELQNEKRQWTLFDNDRQKMLTVLQQDSDFESAMKENIAIIKFNRDEKISTTAKAGISIGIVSFIIMCAGPLYNSSLIGLGFGVLIIGFFVFIIGVAGYKKPLIINHFITNVYEPFVKSNQGCYKELNIPYFSDSFVMGIIEEEIYEPDKITQRISRRIGNIDKQIAEIEQQIQLMQDMQ